MPYMSKKSNVGRFCCQALLAGSLLALGASRAHAAYTIYSDPAAFVAAVPGAVQYTFSGGSTSGTAQDLPYYDGPMGFSTTVRTTHVFLYQDDTYGPSTSYIQTVGPGGSSASQPTIPNTIYALGYFMATPQGADTVTATADYFNAAGTFTTSATPGATVFYGIVSDAPIAQVKFFETNSSRLDITSFYTSAVPEPTTLGLASVGALTLSARRRRK